MDMAEWAPIGAPAPRASPAAPPPTVQRSRDPVEFAVSSPSTVVRNVPFLIDTWAFLPDDRNIAVRRAREALGKDSSFRSGGPAMVTRGTKLKIELQLKPWTVEPEFQTMVWAGNVASVSFHVTPNVEMPGGRVQGVCKVYARGIRISEVRFDVRLSNKQDETRLTMGRRLTGFVSYASKDRRRVLATVHGIEKFATVFMDVRDLDSGAPYPNELLEKIDESDVLYLFWSRHAKASAWVEREWRYGMEHHGIEFIDPVPLVDPRKVPPPEELAAEKHFNHWTLAFLEYEKSVGIWPRIRSWLAGD